MVARNTDADVRRKAASPSLISRFLASWQRLLSVLVSESQVTAVSVATRIAEEARTGPRKLLALRSPALAWSGAICILIGAFGTVALSPVGVTRSVAIAAAVMSVVWGGVRWALLRATATGSLARDPHAVRGAWALGSLAWLLGVTPELRAVAWAASGAVTWTVLERLGATRRQVAVCVGIAWGVQALVVIGSWLARNALVVILANGS